MSALYNEVLGQLKYAGLDYISCEVVSSSIIAMVPFADRSSAISAARVIDKALSVSYTVRVFNVYDDSYFVAIVINRKKVTQPIEIIGYPIELS